MIDEHLIFEEKKPFLHITINRPEDGNKFLDDMLHISQQISEKDRQKILEEIKADAGRFFLCSGSHKIDFK